MRQATKPKTTGKHVGFGKVILFGEHLVVYGAPAIVAGVSEYTQCDLELTPGKPGWVVDDHRPAVPGYIKNKAAEQKKAHKLVLDHLKIDLSQDGLLIRLGGPLVPSSGIGASASDVVSLSRALSEMYALNLTEEQVNESAFVGEGGYHGTPSGVDNTAATFGGLLSYKRLPGKSKFEPINFVSPLHLLVVGTGITASTTQVVGDVRKMREVNPEFFSKVMGTYDQLLAQGMDAVTHNDKRRLGRVMNKNHEILQSINVSCKELEEIVSFCRAAGALGAKMSGTGRGGIAVALCASRNEQRRIGAQLKADCSAAKFVWLYTVEPPANVCCNETRAPPVPHGSKM